MKALAEAKAEEEKASEKERLRKMKALAEAKAEEEKACKKVVVEEATSTKQ
eukprot:gene4837-34593_t